MDNLESRGMIFVKACVHLDETTPHIAAFAVPFDTSGKLNAKSTSRWSREAFKPSG
jgi:hypothetical protein